MLPYIYLYSFLFIAAILSFVLNKEEQQIRLFNNSSTVAWLLKNKKRPIKLVNNGSSVDWVLKNEKQQTLLFYLVSLVVWLFIALRDVSVGTDTQTYVSFFHHPNFYYNGEETDIMFEVLGRVLYLFGESTEYFIFASATITFFGIFYLIQKLSANKTLSLVLFSIIGTSSIFFFLYLSMIRQACALTVFFMAVYLFFTNSKKYWIHSILLYFIAVLIHGSVLVSLPILFLTRIIKMDRKPLWIGLIFLTYLFSVNPWFSISEILSFGYSKLSFLSSRDYSHYTEITFGMIEDKGWFNMNLLPFIFVGVAIITFATKEELNQWYVKLFIFSILLNNIFYDNLMWSRLILYFSIFVIIVIPNIMRRQKKWIKTSFYIVIFTYYSYKTGSQLIAQISPFATGNIIVPYTSWISQ